MKWLKIFAGLMVFVFLLAGFWTYWFVYRGLPSIHELKQPEPTRLSTVIASDGSPIGYFPPEGMIIKGGKDIPVRLIQAFIAAEDSTFYRHAGLDITRIIGALIADIRANSYVQGASTITQQVVRSYLLSREKTITRKLKEIVLALRIERALSKEEILHLYLDRLYLGSGAYGVGAASLRYFNKECRDLNLAEMAMIAGLAPAPARYSPLNDFPAAKRRQNYVLTRMVEEGYITESEAADAYREPLMITGESVALFTNYPYVTDYVKYLVTERYGEEMISKGINVQTTISPRFQDAAIQAVRKGIIELEMRQGTYRGPEKGISETRKERILAFQENQLAWKGRELYRLYWAEVVSVSPFVVNIGGKTMELSPQSYAWINPKGSWTPSGVLAPGNIIRLCYTPDGFVVSQEPRVQASLIAFDLQSDGSIALVGGFDYSQSQFNRAVSAKRQSGSAIKPFIYAAAIDKGFTPATIIFDTPITFQTQKDEEPWKPKNYEDRFYGATTLRTGLVLSRNVVTIKILKDIGIGYSIAYMKRFGMEADFPMDLSLALGSGSMTPYNLAKGYATFATYGLSFNPRLVDYITQIDIGPIFSARSDASVEPGSENESRAISEQTAYIITNILTDVVQNGTGWRAKELGRPVAGKTGTSDDNRDAWFIGYTPEILCGVWVGYDDMMPLGENETGSRAACPIFLDFMRVALKDRPVRDFPIPEGIVFAKVDTKTGRLASERSQNVRFECFKSDGLPPKEQSTYDELLLKEVY
ncbi:MAG: Penicillin-binding protein 1A [Deltaproteobacteria bacterium ADurb.BinA179]|jgi:penicillin-binding protein 1A|nr:MAG: Penicillin-binding protein 1A [Deltaproteobacteria bacterium ADurb.BinA179]